MRLSEYPDDIGFATAIATAPTEAALPPHAPAVPSALMEEARFFRRLGLAKPLISSHLVRAAGNGTTLETELLASGAMTEATYYEALAETLGLPFRPVLDAALLHDLPGADSQLATPKMARLHHSAHPPVTVVVPEAARLAEFRAMLDRTPALRARLAVTTPSALRAGLWAAGSRRRLGETVGGLFDATPEASARVTLWGRQGFYVGTTLGAALSLAILQPIAMLFLLHVTLTLFFLATFLIRFEALRAHRRAGRQPPAPHPGRPRPIYSVFVALYREAAVVPQLVQTLDRLEWPRSRLDIKLICEADDPETLAALAAMPLGPQYEIVAVPPAQPRTKPKALAYALYGARGEYLAVYDAEDRVDPRQLEEAWRRFEAGPPELACLQAPLVVTNARESWFSALFALEYAGLFRTLLPRLAAARLPMPLGGTSNHFRTHVLKAVGGWDPHNVTEDADLGLRLYRHGYRCGTIDRPTYEDAPSDGKAWLGQRTRWFKGWLQTWLVMLRQPARLVTEMGPWPAFVAQVLIGGLVFSSLAHPLMLAYVLTIAWLLQQSIHGSTPVMTALFVLDIVNIFGSYAIFVALGQAAMTPGERAAVGWMWLRTPLYWLMISLAAWRALRELRTAPFFWNKTEHRPAESGQALTPARETGGGTDGGREVPGSVPHSACIP